MSFQVPYDYSSSPVAPSTPDRRSGNGKNIFAMSNPSTTPAGPPPPSSVNSFTPAGQPPSSVFGSSIMEPSNPIKPLSFAQKTAFNHSSRGYDSPGSSQFVESLQSSAGPSRSRLNQEYKPTPRRGFQAPDSDYEDEDSGDYTQDDDTFDQSRQRKSVAYQDDDSIADEEPQYDVDDSMDDYQSEFAASRTTNGRSLRSFGHRSTGDLLLNTPGALQRSQQGGGLSLEESFGARRKSSTFGKIAKDMVSQMKTPETDESDDLILNTESIITRLYEEGIENTSRQELQETLTDIAGELTILWSEYYQKTRTYNNDAYVSTIGPGVKESSFAKANFVAGLVMQLHHPPPDVTHQNNIITPFPYVMLIWMDLYHNPFPSQIEEVITFQPSPASHRLFWDTLFNCLLRGNVGAVFTMLDRSNWRSAHGALGDSPGPEGYSEQVVANIEKVIEAAANLFLSSPVMARRRHDWNTRSSDWTIFRLQAAQALEDLKKFAEGRDTGEDSTNSRGYGKSTLGDRNSYSTIAEKAGSKIPWSIYQNLVTLYSFALGDKNTIIESAQDWCEATIGLLVWWDEGKEDRRIAIGQSRLSQRGYQEEESEVYFRKLRKSFETATAEGTDFKVNTLNPVEVALAAVFDGDYEAVIGFLQGWSGPVSSAIAEVATIGGWLPAAEPQSLINMGGLDQDDMDLLGISSASKTDGVKDQTLITYAKSISHRGLLRSTGSVGRKQVSREGWEVAIAVLGRLESATRSEEMVGTFLKEFQLDSPATVDKLWLLLNDVGMARHAEDSAELYADNIAENTHNYGEAMWYYALAHKSEKVRDVLHVLISYSLLQSTAFPPASELDEHLRKVISSPKSTLLELSRMDVQSAELLRNSLSGYATLRKFFDLRDEQVLSPPNSKPAPTGVAARKREAAAALFAVITSSSDNIRGGLYDEERGAVVSVDFLLALLGEALPFVNQHNIPLTISQIQTLLRAIEDLQSVGPRVFNACSEFLQTVLASAQGLKGSAPSDMLRKSTSNISGGGSFSMVGSSMLASQMKQSMAGSGVLVKGNIKRGWDWRKGASANMKAEDLLRMLRLALAKALADTWLMDWDKVL